MATTLPAIHSLGMVQYAGQPTTVTVYGHYWGQLQVQLVRNAAVKFRINPNEFIPVIR